MNTSSLANAISIISGSIIISSYVMSTTKWFDITLGLNRHRNTPEYKKYLKGEKIRTKISNINHLIISCDDDHIKNNSVFIKKELYNLNKKNFNNIDDLLEFKINSRRIESCNELLDLKLNKAYSSSSLI